MDPPRRPNEPPEHGKEGSVTVPIVDDMTLMTFVSVLFALIQYFAYMNRPQCTC